MLSHAVIRLITGCPGFVDHLKITQNRCFEDAGSQIRKQAFRPNRRGPNFTTHRMLTSKFPFALVSHWPIHSTIGFHWSERLLLHLIVKLYHSLCKNFIVQFSTYISKRKIQSKNHTIRCNLLRRTLRLRPTTASFDPGEC